MMNKLDIKKIRKNHNSTITSSKEALKDVKLFFDIDCCDCKFFDGECCMYDCKSKAIVNCEDEAKNCNHYSIGEFNWDELEKSNYK